MSRRLAGRIAAVTIVLALLPAFAGAHQRSLSYSTWEIDGRSANVRLRIAELDLTRIPPPAADEREIGVRLAAWLGLFAGEERCEEAEPPLATRPEPGWVVFRWTVRCSSDGPLRLRSDLFAGVFSRHLHFARVDHGGTSREQVLSEREQTWSLESAAATDTGFIGYLWLGVEHILTGYDHLAFVLALLLVSSSLGSLARVVTGFTIGHSLTLAAAATDAVVPQGEPIEALIGLSIALVAVENLWLLEKRGREFFSSGDARLEERKGLPTPLSFSVPAVLALVLAVLAAAAASGFGAVPAMTLAGFALFVPCYFGLLARSTRPEAVRGAVAFLFGLLHGFGFASVLVEAGLPGGRLLGALLGFNFGVEIGQLAVVALLWLALLRAGSWRTPIAEAGSASVLALGTFWFVTRTFA